MNNPSIMRCESCGNDSPLRDAEFGMNIGALIVRFHWVKRGRLCAPCIHATFWPYTLTTLALGWWGIISFFVTPVILVMNIITYATVFFTKPYPIDPPRRKVDPEASGKLEPYRAEILQRLLSGERMPQVAEDIGARLGLSADDVIAFYNRA